MGGYADVPWATQDTEPSTRAFLFGRGALGRRLAARAGVKALERALSFPKGGRPGMVVNYESHIEMKKKNARYSQIQTRTLTNISPALSSLHVSHFINNNKKKLRKMK